MTYNRPFWNLTISVVDHCNYNCKHCMHFTTYRPPREHKAQEFIPSIKTMMAMGILTDQEILLAGGEPFIHSDLPSLVHEFGDAIPLPLTMQSNGFWLRKGMVEQYRNMLQRLHYLVITEYVPLDQEALAEVRTMTLVRTYPRRRFAAPSFPSTPQEPNIPEVAYSRTGNYCRFADCLQLLPDGILMRCPAGYAGLSTFPTSDEFRSSQHMFYDLRNPPEDFRAWWDRYPFDACWYCRLDSVPHQFHSKFL